jgi:hypothetical protein
MNYIQYAIIAEILPRLTDDDLETLRKVIAQMQDARRADKQIARFLEPEAERRRREGSDVW